MPNLTYISPSFIVTNLKDSLSFYQEKLGFEIRHIGPDEDAFWAIVGRDNISIFLKAIAPGVNPIPNHTRHAWARWDAYISASDPDALFEEYKSRGLTFHQSITDDGDGLHGFEIKDVDGYVLFFGRPKS